MFGNLFANIPDVTKNLLILNVVFFIAKAILASQGIDLGQSLGMHYPASQYFEPYQIVTHIFMHGDFFHLLFNMIGLIVFGSHLERVWGKKRFFTFYFVTAFGAVLLHTFVQGIELYNYIGDWFPSMDVYVEGDSIFYQLLSDPQKDFTRYDLSNAAGIMYTNTVGASGAIYGLLMAFALLFPNTQFMLLFPPIPIKAKWLAIILGAFAIFSGFERSPGDSVAHFAHLGGMLFGFIMIKIWQNNKSNFY